MVSKKILGVAIAAAFSTQAFAAINLGTVSSPAPGTVVDATGAVTIAKESVLTGQVVSGMVQATDAGAFDTTVALGFGVSAGSHAFVRFDLTNAKFLANVTAASLTLGSGVTTTDWVVQVAQGGNAGDSYVIFDVTAVTAQTQAQTLILNLTGMQLSPTAPATISYAHYSNSPAAAGATATNTTGALATDSYQFASVAPVLTAAISATANTADVNATTPFTLFTGSTPTATLGSIKFSWPASTDATGTAITTLGQLIDTAAGKSSLTVSGDLSFIGLTNAATTATKLTFGGVNSDVNSAGTSIVPTGKLTTLSGLPAAVLASGTYSTTSSIIATANGTSLINAGSYSLAFGATSLSGTAYGATGASGALGDIKRNGATVQVPYLTTNPSLNQKLVLVNRGSSDTTYAITFTPEAGVTAAAGTKATGTLAKNSTLVLKATDVVALTGGTRTAATIVALTPAGNVDAATQTVVTDTTSVSYGSNDTVNLDVK